MVHNYLSNLSELMVGEGWGQDSLQGNVLYTKKVFKSFTLCMCTGYRHVGTKHFLKPIKYGAYIETYIDALTIYWWFSTI